MPRLTAWALRSLFNSSGIWESALRGDLVIVRKETTPAAAYHQPAGTLSVTTHIYEKPTGQRLIGTKVAITHHFEDPDGTIRNRAGRPDPKMVRTQGQTYVLG